MKRFLTFNRFFFFVFFLTHTFALITLGNIIAFAPDELSYINCFQELYKDTFDISKFGGWWNAQTIFLRALYLPAQMFSFLPISDLVLLRLYAISMTAIALFLLIKQTKLTHSHLGKIVLIVFTFTPSIFMWTTLAIKESFIFFTLVGFFLGLMRILKHSGISGYVICFLAGYSLLNLKGYLYVVLSISLGVTVVAKSVKSIKFSKPSAILILVVFLPYVVSPGTTALIRESSIGFMSKLSEFRIVDEIIDTNSPDTNSPDTNSPDTNSPDTNSPDTNLDLGMTLKLLSDNANRRGIFDSLITYSKVNNFLTDREAMYRGLSQQDIYSMRTLNPVNPTDLSGFAYGVTAFLLFPNIFRNNGSPILDLLGYEFYFWIFLYLVTIYIGFRSRSHLLRLVPICLMTFGSMFLIVSEMTEINLGTALRHRLVFAALILIFIGFQNFPGKGKYNDWKN